MNLANHGSWTTADDGQPKAAPNRFDYHIRIFQVRHYFALFRSQSIKHRFLQNAQPVEIDSNDQDHADDNLLDERRDRHHVEAEANGGHGQCADDRAADVAAPSHQARAADHHRGNCMQLVAEADTRMGRIDTGGKHDGRDSDEAAAEGVDGHLEASHWNAGASGCLFTSPDGVGVSPQLRLTKDERSNKRHDGQDDDWHGYTNNLAAAEEIELLRKSVHGEATAQCQRKALRYTEHTERDDEW